MFEAFVRERRSARSRLAAQRGQSQVWLVWGVFAGLLIVVGLFGLGAYIGFKRHQDTQKELQALRDTGHELIEQQRRLVDGKPGDASAAPAPKAGATVPARNEAEMLRGFNAALREIGARNYQTQTQIAAEVEKLNLPQVLAPERLTSAQGRRESRATVQSYLQLVERSVADGRRSRAELRGRVEILVSRLTNGSRLLDQYDKSVSSRTDLEEQTLRNQRQSAELLLQAVELIERAGQRVQNENGQLVFADQRALDRYNAIIERIQAAGREEQQLMRRAQTLLNQAQAAFDKVER
ncbi:DUF3053 family protein [Lysobacter sp. K5869]|uniref:DUF3053 family protein n=1 Tax=Lysobacter sp. K5869 TaxID=2820808 RepID=UPI001C064493|nr:DUF3053 family protein [Lysobacter sp. K5869]QWP78145.1 DUF3053 family protein [Lysobacter sp. K5869]